MPSSHGRSWPTVGGLSPCMHDPALLWRLKTYFSDELLLKLGIRIAPRTVRKYMPKRPHGQPPGDQRWSIFVRNHASAILTCDFCVVVTATFRLLYALVVIEHQTGRIVYLTAHPPQRGHSSNCEKPSPPTIAIVFSFMTAMPFSQPSWTHPLLTWDCVYLKRHLVVSRLTASVNGSSARYAENAWTS